MGSAQIIAGGCEVSVVDDHVGSQRNLLEVLVDVSAEDRCDVGSLVIGSWQCE